MHAAIRTLLSWCLLSLSVVTGLAHAQQDDLYSVRVAVENQSAAARYEALQEGLRQVLVKITGQSRIDRNVLPRANRELEDFVSEYLYQPALEPEFHETGVDLVARFMPASVDRIVRELGLPVWPASRPRVLVWLVTESAEGPRFLSAGQIPELERALLTTFEKRAVAMRQPLLDLEDQFAFPPEEAWSLEPDLLHEASQRYSAPVVLLLRLQPPSHALELLAHPDVSGAELVMGDTSEQPSAGAPDDQAPWWIEGGEEDAEADSQSLSSGIWASEWLLLSEEHTYQEATAPAELATVIAASIDNAIDALARTQTYLPSEDDGEVGVHMEVRDLLTLNDFRRAEALVRGMEMVQDLRLVALEGDKARFELVLTGGSDVFLQSLRNSGHFNHVMDQASPGRPSVVSEPMWGGATTGRYNDEGYRQERHDQESGDQESRDQESRDQEGHDQQSHGHEGTEVAPMEMAPASRSFHFSWVP